MRGGIQAHFGAAIPAGLIRKLDAGDFGVLGKIHDRKSVEVGKLDKDAAGRAVGIGAEGHRAYAIVEFDLPSDLVGLEIDDRSCLGFDGAGQSKSAVRRDVNIVNGSLDRNGLCKREGGCVNYVDRARGRVDAHQNAAAVFGDGKVVGISAEGNFFQDFAVLAVDDVEHALRLIADVHPRAIRRKIDAVGQLYAANDLHQAVCRGIDDVDGVAGAVGNVDERSGLHFGAGGSVGASDPLGQSKPIWIILGFKLPSPGMEGISSGFCRQRVDQQQTGIRITRANKPGHRLKVLSRLLFRPSCGARGEFFEMENAGRLRMAAVAAGMPGTLFQEYGLYHGFKQIEVQGAACRTGSCILRLFGIRRLPGVNFTLYGRSGYDRMEACHHSNDENAESCFAKIGHFGSLFRRGRNINAKARQLER